MKDFYISLEVPRTQVSGTEGLPVFRHAGTLLFKVKHLLKTKEVGQFQC